MKVIIFKPAKTAMQSGLANTKLWLLELIEEENSKSINQLTGWTSCDNTKTQLKLKFKSKKEAIKYATDQGFDYIIGDSKIPSVKKKSYVENFTK